MYEIIKNVINTGDYELKDFLEKINIMYIEGEITKEQKDELDNIARKNANPEKSYAPVQKQIDNIYVKLDEIQKRLDTLEGKEPPIEEEYPEYKQPTGSHDSYNIGDKITFEGKKYSCLLDNCVWSPAEYPSVWQEIV